MLALSEPGTDAPAPFDQRWERRQEFRRTAGTRIDPTEYGVEVVGDGIAKPFIREHHYSGSYPAAHVAIGLYRRTGLAPARLVGVAVFSEGVRSQLAMPKWTGFDRADGTELGRLVLLPEVPYNGETWFITRAFDILRTMTVQDPHARVDRQRFRVVLSYSDPIERQDAAGNLVKPGHFGTIYQATNALYVGRATPRTLHISPSGQVVHAYAFDKVAAGRRNHQSAARSILEAGVSGMAPDEAPRDWVARVKAELATIRHPGNFTYVFGLDAGAWRSLRLMHGKGFAYPKARDLRQAA